MRRSPGPGSNSSRFLDSNRKDSGSSYRRDQSAHSREKWRSESPLHRGMRGGRGGGGFRRFLGRSRGKDDRFSPNARKSSYRPPNRDRGMQRRFSPPRNRKRSLSRDRATSPRSERKRGSSSRNGDRNRPHDRSRKSYERKARSSPPHNERSSKSPVIFKQNRKRTPPAHWDRNQISGSDRGGSHHNELYKDMMDSQNMDCRSENDMGMGQRPRGFSPERSHQASDIDERMQGRSNSPYRTDRFPDNNSNRGYKNDSQQMMNDEGMSHNQGFPAGNYPGNNNRASQDDFVNRDSMNSEFNVMNEVPKPYTQEELKKITVDIFRNVPPEHFSSNKRLVINPEDVIVVRRSGEGIRPIFDRDEIKQAQQAKDVTFERRVVAMVNDRSESPHMNPPTDFTGSPPGERENFQISSEHFNAYSNPNTSTRQSLNDRWQRMQMENMNMGNNPMMMKNSRPLSSCRDIPYDQQQNESRSDNQMERPRSRSRSHSPISRRPDNRFGGRRSSYNDDRRNRRWNPSLYDRRERFQTDNSSNRQFDQGDLRRRNNAQERHDHKPFFGRDGGSSQSNSGPDRLRQEMNERNFETRPPIDNLNEDRGDGEKLEGGDKLPNFSTRPDKYQYQEWLEKPDVVPKGPSYFEHDNRGERKDRDVRGGRGVGRGRGFRGRTFRPRGFAPRARGGQQTFMAKSKWSPNHWQHDMFERSPDQNSVQDNNPSSTTGSK